VPRNINSTLGVRELGALFTGQRARTAPLTAINCRVAKHRHRGGYGSYAIGATPPRTSLGLPVSTVGTSYAHIKHADGTAYYADSTRAAVAKLNTSLSWASPRELAADPVCSNTVIDSKPLGMMWHGAGSVTSAVARC